MNAPLDPDSDAQLPRWFGDYVLLKRLGKGGMGTVYLARSPGVSGIDRFCVIKTLRSQWTNDREYVARFVDEARIVVHLHHRNICPVFDVGQVGSTFYLAMDLVAGRDLQAVLERCARAGVTLPLDLSLLIIAEILDALDAAHRLRDPQTDEPLRLVHRDISPHNALVSFEGDVKLIDFGLAQSALKQEHTEPGVVLGKLAYMAPEHARGDDVDLRADLFAVGVMLYELASGERYWHGKTQTEIWQEVGRGGHVPARLAGLPVDVQRVIERATAALPRERYKSGAEMRAAITSVQLARGVLASAAELREQLELLFDGEAAADRKERAALLRMPMPAPIAAPRESTRIAKAPGPDAPVTVISSPLPTLASTVVAPNPTTLPVAEPTLRSLPSPASPATEQEPWAQATSSADSAPEDDTIPGRQGRLTLDELPTLITRGPAVAAPNTAPPAPAVDVPPQARTRRSPLALGAAAVALVVVGAVVAVAAARSSGPAVVAVDAGVAFGVMVNVDSGVAEAVVVDAGVAEAVVVDAGVAEAVVVDAGVAEVVVDAGVAEVVVDAGVARVRENKPRPVVAWPATWPFLIDGKIGLLRSHCLHLKCTKKLAQINTKSLDTTALIQLQEEATQCLNACKASRQ